MDSNFFGEGSIKDTLAKHNVYFLPYEELLTSTSVSKLTFNQIVLVIDQNVFGLWQNRLIAPFRALGDRVRTFILRCDERSKTMETACRLYDFLVANAITKNCLLISIGGGITSDICGFVASTYLRGAHYAIVPTTLMGMVDAGIGGKNGLNFNNRKNAIGTFYNPTAVLIDTDFLKTLNQREFSSGKGEILKYSLISGNDYSGVFNSTSAVKEAIASCITIKLSYVDKDYYDNNIRHILNLGHTIGHSLETAFGYSITHGEAVVNGIYFETKLGCDYGIVPNYTFNNVYNAIQRFGFRLLPNLNVLKNVPIFDKKQEGDDIYMPFLINIGDCRVVSIQRNTLLGWISNSR
ncbi:MAG: 3-dehydroquinate synthase [Clostridia bacterium]|nr:3-dehydroquinate synthase [Clostridia bacterium]